MAVSYIDRYDHGDHAVVSQQTKAKVIQKIAGLQVGVEVAMANSVLKIVEIDVDLNVIAQRERGFALWRQAFGIGRNDSAMWGTDTDIGRKDFATWGNDADRSRSYSTMWGTDTDGCRNDFAMRGNE